MSTYKVLQQQVFSEGRYSIVPIRSEDRWAIMKWRNEQIYHLRQDRPLTGEDQDRYFSQVVAALFGQDAPGQLLFSYLEDDTCIGYGGLVHINWADKHAEISFIMDTELEKEHFSRHWNIYLDLLERLAFAELGLHKIFTYAFDLRPHLYPIFEAHGFSRDARLREHILYNGRYVDVIIHSKLNNTK